MIILVIITSATVAGAVEVAAVKTAVKIIITLLLKIIAIIIEAKIIRVKTINPINQISARGLIPKVILI
jgi:hypothetical protein